MSAKASCRCKFSVSLLCHSTTQGSKRGTIQSFTGEETRQSRKEPFEFLALRTIETRYRPNISPSLCQSECGGKLRVSCDKPSCNCCRFGIRAACGCELLRDCPRFLMILDCSTTCLTRSYRILRPTGNQNDAASEPSWKREPSHATVETCKCRGTSAPSITSRRR